MIDKSESIFWQNQKFRITNQLKSVLKLFKGSNRVEAMLRLQEVVLPKFE